MYTYILRYNKTPNEKDCVKQKSIYQWKKIENMSSIVNQQEKNMLIQCLWNSDRLN